ncbi:redoxin domain-containing protein [Anatilimnocola sp. NA78]|uniref:redoxin domain-containing protein n=1 Tax=Anatilimnocola sp. NA78 TaxID=3415683 RepID=UPI003CE4D902
MRSIMCSLLFLVSLTTLAFAQEKLKTHAELIAANPNDAYEWQEYWRQQAAKVGRAVANDRATTVRLMEEVEGMLAKHQATAPQAAQMQMQIAAWLEMWKSTIEANPATSGEAAKQLLQKPDDSKALTAYLRQAGQEIASGLQLAPDLAELQIKTLQAHVAQVKAAAKEESRSAIDKEVANIVEALKLQLAAIRKRENDQSKDATPLKLETWLQGTPVTDADLQGKVVIINFWAPWCPYCTKLAPRLAAWHEKYADRGLVIVGVTDYSNAEWNDAAQRAERVAGKKVPPDDEHKAMTKYAEVHGWKFPIAVDNKNQKLAKFYGPRGVPALFLIDQRGQVRLTAGQGAESEQQMTEALERLLPEPLEGSPVATTNAPPTAQRAVARLWSDVSGKFKIQAELVSYDKETVRLKKADGNEIAVPRSRLSAADQAFLDSLPAAATNP